MKEKAGKTSGIGIKQYVMLIVLLVIIGLFQWLTKGVLLTSLNVFNLINQNAYIMILAVGMLICILTGGNVDLSVGSIIGFTGAVMATLMNISKLSPYLAIVVGLGLGTLLGAWQGFWIAYVRIPPFITTLSGMLVFRGATMMVLEGGKTIAPLPAAFTALASGYLGTPETAGTISRLSGIVLAVLFLLMQVLNYAKRKKSGYTVEGFAPMLVRNLIISVAVVWLFFTIAEQRGIPSVLITTGLIALLYNYLTKKTIIGRHIYALGGNAKAAKLSGVKTERLMFLAYVNMGLLSSVAAVAYCARINAAAAAAGDGAELDAIAACFIGGASAYGGVGTVGGALIGALIMGVLNNGMSIIGLGTDMQQAVKGLVLLVAVAVDVLSKQKTLAPMLDRIRRKLAAGKSS